jgi:penicillin amidase
LLDDILSAEQLAQFTLNFPDWAPTMLKDADVRATLDGVEVLPLEEIGETLRGRDADSEAQAQPENRPGSNAWVVSGERTESGAPLLANDPHLGLGAPSIWYFVRLNLSYGPVIGGTIPGTPSVVLGRNAHGAWGFTNTGFDVIDYVERDPGAIDVTERRETIRVRGGDDVELVIRETPEGPVLDEQWFDLSPFDPDKLVVWRSTSTHPDNDSADATLAIMKSTGWDSFVDAVRGWTAPMQNMHYAGIDGTIGYTTAGLLPVRDEAGEWTGFVPFDELPRVENPRGGYIASGNNLVAGDVYPCPLPGSYAVYRAPRIEAMIEATERHDADSFAAMQLDVTSLHIRRILPALLAAEPESELGAAAIARLEGWDASLDPDEPEGLIVSAWLRALSAAIWSDELGALAGRFDQPRRAFLEDVLAGDASAWCDDVRTASVERCATIAGLALDAAMARTAAQYGEDIDAWRWGEVHQAVFDHAFTGQPILGGMFTVREPVGGDGSTVNVGHFSYAAGNYDAYHGASMRAIYDLADLNESRFMHAPGQSGHPLSPHYDDLAPKWAAGEYFQIRDDWTPENPPEGARTLRLVPAAAAD